MNHSLSARAIASPYFSFLPGMRVIDTNTNIAQRIVGEEELARTGDAQLLSIASKDGDAPQGAELVLDGEDPATIGCLLSLVRVHLPYSLLVGHGSEWRFAWSPDQHNLNFSICSLVGESALEVLVLALELIHE